MLIYNASQLITLTADPQRGEDLGNLNIISNGAVLSKDGRIEALGNSDDLLSSYPTEPRYDAGNRVVMPGFVDPHTHLVWSGDRAGEFELRVQGKTYLEILAAGGGILSTVKATRVASLSRLIEETRPRLRAMFRHGTTTAEAKTGYGLRTATELRMLQALLALDTEGPVELAITFLGAHAIAPEFSDAPDEYTNLICEIMLPLLATWWPLHAGDRPLPFVDVFCETGAFDLSQSRLILEVARSHGFPLKIHADEFDNLGGARIAVELGAVSADHLVATSAGDIAALATGDTVCVALPCTPFGLAEHRYTPARAIIESGGLLAIATDLNPGTAWCESMQFAIALACRYLRLTPAQAIAAATINAAAAIGREGVIGSLSTGKQADLLVLNVSDYRHLGYRFGTNLVQAVFKKGVLYSINPDESIEIQ